MSCPVAECPGRYPGRRAVGTGRLVWKMPTVDRRGRQDPYPHLYPMSITCIYTLS